LLHTSDHPKLQHFEVIKTFDRFNNGWQFANSYFRLDDLSGTAGLIPGQFDYKHDVILDVKARKTNSGEIVRDVPNMITIPTADYNYAIGSAAKNTLTCTQLSGKPFIFEGWLGDDEFEIPLECSKSVTIKDFNSYWNNNIIYLDPFIRNDYYIKTIDNNTVQIHSTYNSLNDFPSKMRVQVEGNVELFKDPDVLNDESVIKFK